MAKGISCPLCGWALKYDQVNLLEPFPCPSCQEKLRVRVSYWRWVSAVSAAVSILLLWGLGVRGLNLVLGIVVVSFPLQLLALLLAKRIAPPKIERHRPDSLSLDLRRRT